MLHSGTHPFGLLVLIRALQTEELTLRKLIQRCFSVWIDIACCTSWLAFPSKVHETFLANMQFPFAKHAILIKALKKHLEPACSGNGCSCRDSLKFYVVPSGMASLLKMFGDWLGRMQARLNVPYELQKKMQNGLTMPFAFSNRPQFRLRIPYQLQSGSILGESIGTVFIAWRSWY